MKEVPPTEYITHRISVPNDVTASTGALWSERIDKNSPQIVVIMAADMLDIFIWYDIYLQVVNKFWKYSELKMQ